MRPYRIDIPQSELDDLNRRIAATRWPAPLPGAGWERGVPQEYLRELAGYWLNSYDWRAAEARLNELPQFVTELDGAQVHFLHVRSPEPSARPLLVTHGWPGSVAEFVDVAGPLTDPAAHGGDPADAFHLIVPSIPGYGFSGPAPETGWGLPRVARAWAELMARLGYDRYIAHGGDWGSLISQELGRIDAEHVVGVHTSMLVTIPSGDPEELAGLGEEDLAKLGRLSWFDTEGSGYMKLLQTRPFTPSYGMNDSPVGLLAWIVEKFQEWTTPSARPEDVVDIDQLLTDVTIYWLTGTASSSAQFYFEVNELLKQAAAAGVAPPPLTVPVGVAVYGNDCILPLRRLADRDVPTIVQWNEYERGGHFAAMELPAEFVADLRSFGRAVKDRED
ncbi:epoxide hydrolase family protein [Amycolatopsis sp. NPDC004747]